MSKRYAFPKRLCVILLCLLVLLGVLLLIFMRKPVLSKELKEAGDMTRNAHYQFFGTPKPQGLIVEGDEEETKKPYVDLNLLVETFSGFAEEVKEANKGEMSGLNKRYIKESLDMIDMYQPDVAGSTYSLSDDGKFAFPLETQIELHKGYMRTLEDIHTIVDVPMPEVEPQVLQYAPFLKGSVGVGFNIKDIEFFPYNVTNEKFSLGTISDGVIVLREGGFDCTSVGKTKLFLIAENDVQTEIDVEVIPEVKE